MEKGKLIIISGPSGVGKETIRKEMKFNDYIYSISSTTREPRNGEIDGQHYNFLTIKEFEDKIKNNEMLEYAKFVNNYYGTEQKVVDNYLNKGKNVLLEIECQGALQVINKMPEAISIFILPPSIDELKNRLIKRNTESIEIINQRIEKAQEEMNLKDLYKYNVINDDVQKAALDIDRILFKECNDTN